MISSGIAENSYRERKYPKISETRYKVKYSTNRLANKNPYRKEKITHLLRTFTATEKNHTVFRGEHFQLIHANNVHIFILTLPFLPSARKFF